MSANETQVGGTHYRAHGRELQHWDLAVLYQWDPFQYQITKYVMRWKHKHTTHEDRVRDLQKAAHFLQKYIEVAMHYDVAAKPAAISSDADWQVEGYFGDMTQEYKCRHCGATVRAASFDAADAEHGACPRAQGYVDQDR